MQQQQQQQQQQRRQTGSHVTATVSQQGQQGPLSASHHPPPSATNGDISRVYIGGLDRRATHGDLAVFCQQVGQVRGCRVAYDHATNASKCYGYADYATPLDALRAVAYLNGALLFQRPCRVTPVLRDTTSRKGAVRETVAGLTESPAQLTALTRVARDEKLRAALAWRISAHHHDHAECLSRAFVAALGQEPASLLALMAYPTLLEAWVWEALGVSGSSVSSPQQQQHGAGARGKAAAAAAAARGNGVNAESPPLASTTATAGEDAEALELRLDEMVRTFSEDDGGNTTQPGGSAPRNSTSPDSCGSGGSATVSLSAVAGAPSEAPGAAGDEAAPPTEAVLRSALQQYPFLMRVAGQGRPQLPVPAMWRGSFATSAGSAGLSLSGHHHAFATPVVSPASTSPFVSATSTPSGPTATSVSTGSGPVLPIGSAAAHVSPLLLYGAFPSQMHHHHQHHQHHQHPHQQQQQPHGMMPPSPINLSGLGHHLQPNQQHHQQQGARANGSPTGQQQLRPPCPGPGQPQAQPQHQQRPPQFVVAGGPQFPPAMPQDVAAIFGAASRSPAAGAPERAMVPGMWGSPTSATAATVAAMAAFASAAAFGTNGGMGFDASGGVQAPMSPSGALAMAGFFAPPPLPHGGGVTAPFNIILGQPPLHGDPTRSLPGVVSSPGFALPTLMGANVVPPSFPPPGLHRQQRLARQQQQQQRQIAALVAAAASNGAGAATHPGAAGPGGANANGNARRGGAAPSAHLRCLSGGALNGALLPDLANSSPDGATGADGPAALAGRRRLCATSTDSGAALDLLLLQAAASDPCGSASSTAVNTISSTGTASSCIAPMVAAGSMQW